MTVEAQDGAPEAPAAGGEEAAGVPAAAKVVPGRVRCCIAGCGRTFKREAGDSADIVIMCGKHWRMGDQRLRDRHKQLRKRVSWFARRWRHRNKAIIAAGKEAKFDDAWYRAARAANRAWHRVEEDVAIKAALRAEDAPRRRGAL